MFEQTFIPPGGTRRWSVLVAVLSQIFVVGILVVIPLMYVEVLPVPDTVSRILLAPPPPPPPPPPAAPARREPPKVVARKFDPTKLTAPSTIPKQITIQNETAQAFPEAPGIAGVPGGALGGALNSILSAAPPPPPPPVAAATPAPAPPSRIRVGGEVQAGLILREVTPSYPKLAAMAHISGTVRLKAVIGADGSVEDLTLISGHPLLVQAAEAAVKQWIYKPTLLNGQPVEVDTEIDVHFVAS